jgi:hypothetical protein
MSHNNVFTNRKDAEAYLAKNNKNTKLEIVMFSSPEGMRWSVVTKPTIKRRKAKYS